MAKAKGGTPKIEGKPRRKPKFMAFLREGTVAPWVREERWSVEPWVLHGSHNLYPEEVRTLVDNCGPLERSIRMLAQFIAGHGIRFYGPPKENGERGDEIQAAQRKFQEWMQDASEEEFLWRCAYDLAHGLGMTFNVRRSASQIVRLDHLDRFGLRCEKMKDGRITGYWWSSDWRRYMENNSDDRYKPFRLAAFDAMRPEKVATIFRRDYRPREPYYGGLWWMGAWAAAEVWTKVDKYNRTQVDLGFSPGVILGTRFDGPETEMDAYDKDVEETFTGSMGKGVFHIPLGPDEDEPFVKVLERGNHAGELDAMRSGSADVIYDVFGIPSLLMRDRAEGLTSQERAIAIRLQQMQRTLVDPLQKYITQPIQQLMALSGLDVYECNIVPLEIFDPVQSEAIVLASTTVNEARDQRGDEPLEGEDGEMLLAKVKGGAVAPADENMKEKEMEVPPNGKGR